ncbi:TPA: ATP-grasp domain-containing protein [Bacillus cereus]|nr:ATP-grasp domain-containing protein [Bacillus cereus]
MKHILVVGGFKFIPQKLKKYENVKMTLLIEASSVGKQDLTCFDRIIGVPDGAGDEEWVKSALCIHEMDPFHAIGAYHEMNQEKACEIAGKIGLPFHNRKTIECTRDKYYMRKVLHEGGLDNTAFQVVECENDIIDFANQHGYPVILKPVNGWASTGVSVIHSKEDVSSAVKWFNSLVDSKHMYVEEFLEGDEFSVEAFSENGKHHIVCITKKFKDLNHMVEMGHVLPAMLDENQEISIKNLVLNALELFGVQNGGSHTEVILTSEGPRVIESHARLGGDCIPELIEITSGLNLLDLWARQTLGENVLDEVINAKHEKFASIWFNTPETRGTLVEVKGVKELETTEGIENVWVWRPGSIMKGIQSSFTRSSYVISSGQSEQQALERSQRASDKLTFVVEC